MFLRRRVQAKRIPPYRRRLLAERLEDRRVLATIHGFKWDDVNGDGVFGANETGLADWTIYLDQNQNRVLDAGEQSTVTAADGSYSFTNLAAGTYYLAEVNQDGWQPTFPAKSLRQQAKVFASSGPGFGTGTLSQDNLDGSSQITIVQEVTRGFGLDDINEQLYYLTSAGRFRSDLDGGNVQSVALPVGNAYAMDAVNNRLFFTSGSLTYSADLDTFTITQLHLGLSNARDVEYDPVTDTVFVVNTTSLTSGDAIYAVPADGSAGPGGSASITKVVSSSYIGGVAVDSVNRKLYFTNSAGNTVFVSNMDGTEQRVLTDRGRSAGEGHDIEVAPDLNLLVWRDGNSVYRANLDGSDRQAIPFSGPLPETLELLVPFYEVTVGEGDLVTDQNFGNQQLLYDFGDAPDRTQTRFIVNYATTTLTNGARHLALGPTLGSHRDTEADGIPTIGADSDDNTGSPDDEDGVVFETTTLLASTTAARTYTVDVTLQNADPVSNRLDAWIDFDRNGSWLGTGEQIIDNLDLGTTNGTQTLTFTIPQDSGDNVELGETYARFRLSTAGDLLPSTAASDGEVEDYRLTIAQAPPDDAKTLNIDVMAASISEGDGAAATTVTVTRNFDLDLDLKVDLASDDTSEATVPAEVIIPAGETSAVFDLDAVDDAIMDGTNTATITATVQGVGLDSTFGNGGIVPVPLTGPFFATALQTDGKIVSATEGHADGTVAVTRHNTDGTLDQTFGDGGVVEMVVSTVTDRIFPARILIQPDGKILIGGQTTTDIIGPFLIRLDVDGTPDNTYGNAGVADLSGINTHINDMGLTNDGKVVAAVARFLPQTFRVLRVNANGTVDTTFGTGGIVTIPNNTTVSVAIKPLPDGKFILVGGRINITTVVRANADGSLDATFGESGRRLITWPTGSASPHTVELDPSGRVVIGATHDVSGVDGAANFAAARLTADGDLDTSFDSDGIVITDLQAGRDDISTAMAIDDNGKILLVGHSELDPGNNEILAMRYNTDGSIDRTFDSGGVFSFIATGRASQESFDAAVQADGSVVILAGSENEYVLARLKLNAIAHQASDTIDVTDDDAPKVNLSLSSADATELGRTAVTVTATTDDNVVGNQTIDLVVSGTGITPGDFILSASQIEILDGQSSGSVTFTVVDDAVVEALTETATLTIGNPTLGLTIGIASQNVTITDDDYLTPAIDSNANSPNNLSPVPLTVDFGGPVAGFDLSDLSVSGAAASNLTDLTGGKFSFDLTPSADGVITVDIGSAAAQDVGGKDTLAATQFLISSDRTSPMPAIIGPAGSTSSDPFTVTIDFGEPVDGFVIDDVSVGGGTANNLVDNGNGSFTATIDATADGLVTVDVAADVALDDAGNPNVAASQFSIVVDTTAPAPTITGPDSPTSSDPFAVTIDFGETVSGFVIGDLSVGGGTAIELVDNGNGSFTATIDATADGLVTVDVAAEIAFDDVGNTNVAAKEFSIVVDTAAPAPTITGPAGPTSSDPFAVTIDFGEAVSGFVIGDVSVGGGEASKLIDNGNGSFTATIDAIADGLVTVDVAADVAIDNAGNPNVAASPFSIAVDTAAPAPTITGPASPTSSDPFTVTIGFGEPVTGFVIGDISVGGGTVVDLVDKGNGTFTATIDATSDGLVTVDVAADVAFDDAGNPNVAASPFSIAVDTTAIVPAITGPASPTNGDPFTVRIDFGEAVNGFVIGDVSVGGGMASDLVDNGNGSFTVTIDATADGLVTVDVAADVAVDGAGNPNVAASQLSIVVDTTAPAPTITGPASPTSSDPFDVTIEFGETVSGFVIDDVSVGGGTAIELVDHGNGSFTATIDATADGLVTVDVAADVAIDDAGNPNIAASQFSIAVDTAAPFPTITGPASPTSSDPFAVTIDFGETVSDFDVADITVTGGTVIALVDDGHGNFRAIVDATANGDIVIEIDAAVASDAAGNANNAATPLSVAVTANLDFGDAPTATQSGFAADYPVTLAQDGARHLRGSLRLGSQIDTEANGLPSLDADGDGSDEDGISFITSLVSAATATTSSLLVDTSRAGKLDAWIDFNRDGDWDDPGEQIFDSVDLMSTTSVLSFTVSANASSGVTAARFRLSSGGGLDPIGQADDGEVEDYLVTILNGDNGPEATALLVGDPVEISIDSGDVVVRSGQIVRFRASLSDLDSLSIVGSSADESVALDLTEFATPVGGLMLSGGEGSNSLVIGGVDGPADLTDPSIDTSNLQAVDLSDAAATTLTLDAPALAKLSPTSKVVQVVAGEGDQLVVKEPKRWRMADPVIDGNTFYVTAQFQEGVEEIRANVHRPWQNFLQTGDVNNDGSVSALDALIIINQIGTGQYLTADSFLMDPLEVDVWPGYYYDQNGDGKGTALDALRVINALGVETSAEPEVIPSELRADPNQETSEVLYHDERGLTLRSPYRAMANPSTQDAPAASVTLFATRAPSRSLTIEIANVDELLADDSFLDEDLAEWLRSHRH